MSLKILFVCGTFELAKSGVADYIHCLAHELTRLGFKCACIALHDPYASRALADHHLSWQSHELPVIRLSSQIPWRVRAGLLKAELQALNPDWISFHYVPYAYHPKGFPFGLLKCLAPVRRSAQWQIMAHELWVDPHAGPRNRLLSILQRWIAQLLFAMVRPSVVHVTNHWYQSMLSGCGIRSRILPLFSAIPFSPGISADDHPAPQWTFVLFGAINRDWSPEPLLQQIESARVLHAIETCRFVSVGNAGDYGARIWDSLASSSYPAFTFSRLGQLSAESVSEQLQQADFGIAVMPSHLVGKSSAVAAMVANGLPVIISRLSQNCEQWHQSLKLTGHFILLESSFALALGSASKYPPVNTLEATARQFVADLELAM
ncbi:MAG: hypothetical protein NTZ23_05905 [Cyanobium sp. LacPavin_0920_WC12_MAG_63_22]|nr:hypothetical protein [Cyanobium sp. LacPavin_0920_WC12_MAG_63_22]